MLGKSNICAIVATSLAMCGVVWAAEPPADRISVAPEQTSAQFGGQPGYGDPIPGLTEGQLAEFAEGRELFQVQHTVESGLGPVFNKEGCGVCHNAGADPGDPEEGVGGAGDQLVTRFARFIGKGEFDPMVEYGGPLQQLSAIGEEGECNEVVPDLPGVFTINRVTTPMFGAGLIEAIPDATILANADPDDLDNDGISGKARMSFDPWLEEMRVGRFGWKCGVVTLDTFTADASLNEMGITNMLFPEENDPNGMFPPELADCDQVPELEDMPDKGGISAFNRMATFQRFLAAPPRRPLLNGLGFSLFREIGCADCHIPVMFTGEHEVDALSLKPAFLFSDLLLHDMGALGDEMVDGDADGTEMRTAPLWGVRVRPILLHDGRANADNFPERIRQAIAGYTPPVGPFVPGHAGEAADSRDFWSKLSEQEQDAIIEFLDSI